MTKDYNAKTIKIAWQAVPNASSYTVYSAQQSITSLSSPGFTNYSSLTGHAIKTGISGTQYTLSNLALNKTYYVVVQAVNANTSSAYKAGDEKNTPMVRFEKMAGANAGKCVIDHKNNLMWEVKQNNSGLHGKVHTFTWYQTTNNDGIAGTRNGGFCYNKIMGNKCDTKGFVASVNAAGLCGFSDWRMPSFAELPLLNDASATYFPYKSRSYWTSNSRGNSATVVVAGWKLDTSRKNDGYHVGARLVRTR